MKYVIIGDIHGRSIWKSILVKEWDADKYIFLGDYVSTHEDISSDTQISNLSEILAFKNNVKDALILLRGNHDLQHLGYPWAECSGIDNKVQEFMMKNKDYFLNLTQWVYQIPDTNIVCSHAGIGEHFFTEASKYLTDNESDGFSIDDINKIEPCELFGFTTDTPWDIFGTSPWQPCTWIRPSTLLECGLRDYTHVVGHTPANNIVNLKDSLVDKLDPSKVEDFCNIWLCDCLAHNQYLVIEDEVFKVCSLDKE
jgi:3',5'-cyclic AMP phosphodiesterase CpdA